MQVPQQRTGAPQHAINRIVVHITGVSTYNHAARHKISPLQQLWNFFKQPKNNFSHYGIDPWGTIWQFAKEDVRPWAQGWKDYGGASGLRKLLDAGKPVPAWWREAWSPLRSPLDLLLPDEDSPNANSIAIECIQYQPPSGEINYKLTPAQYVALVTLIFERRVAHGLAPLRHLPELNTSIPLEVGHEDVDPWGRGKADGGWDPGARRTRPRFCWTCLTAPLAGPDAEPEHEPHNCPSMLPVDPPRPDWASKDSPK